MIYFARVQATRNKDTVPVCDVLVESSAAVIKDCAILTYGTGSSQGWGGVGVIQSGSRVVVALMGGASMSGPGVVLGLVPSNAVAAQLLSPNQSTKNDPANVFAPTDGKASPGDTVLYRSGPTAILANNQSVRMRATSIRTQISGTEGQWVLGTENADGTVESAIHGEQLVEYLTSLQATVEACVSLTNQMLLAFQSLQAATIPPVPPTTPVTAAQVQAAVTAAALISPATLPVGAPEPVPPGLTSAILKFERVPEEDV